MSNIQHQEMKPQIGIGAKLAISYFKVPMETLIVPIDQNYPKGLFHIPNTHVFGALLQSSLSLLDKTDSIQSTS